MQYSAKLRTLRAVLKAASIAFQLLPILLKMDMGATTMAFRVADPAFLQRFSVGDKVKFVLARQNGQLVVIAMEKAN